MRVKQIKQFKQKDLIIKRISIDYKKMNMLELDLLRINESYTKYLEDEKDDSYYKRVRGKVDYIMSQLDEPLKVLLCNDYFSPSVVNWWIYYYSKSTYYRLKNKAMDAFLEWWYA